MRNEIDDPYRTAASLPHGVNLIEVPGKVARSAGWMRYCLSFTQNSVDGIHKNNVLFP